MPRRSAIERVTHPRHNERESVVRKSVINGELVERKEGFSTVRSASEQLGLPTFKLRAAIKKGLIPSYRFFNGRILVRVSDVLAAIEASRTGGR